MTSTVKNKATPGMSVFPANSKVTWTQTRFGNYKKSITPAYTISKLDKSGKLDMMMLIPTSGHTGLANAQKWAVQSKYNIRIIHADGSVQNLGKIQSVDLVTQHGMSINLQKGMTKIQIWADGSAGVGGFKAGREMEVNWSGN